jgi:U3 small nucleolar RNA-associated protein 14
MLVDPADNPWLNANADTISTKIARSSNEVVVGKGGSAASISKNALKKQLRKTAQALAQAKDDATLEIDVSSVLTSHQKKVASENSQKAQIDQSNRKLGADGNTNSSGTSSNQTARIDPVFGQDEDTDEEREAQEEALNNKGKGNRVKAFEQRELVARAFAGDNVIEVRFHLDMATCSIHTSLLYTDQGVLTIIIPRNLLRRKGERWMKMRLKRLIQVCQAGYVL